MSHQSHHHHHNYPNHGGSLRPHRQSPTGGDSHSGSLYLEGRTELPPPTIAFSTSNSPVPTNVPNTYPQRSSPIPDGQHYYPPTQQQQTLAPDPTYPSIQQLPDTIYDSDQIHGDTYNRASPFPGAVNLRYPPPLDVPWDGRRQGQTYYLPHADLQIPPPNDMHSSDHSLVSSYPQHQLPASFTYPAGHSSSRGAVHTAAAAPTHYQQPMAISQAFYSDHTNPLTPSSRNTMQLPNIHVPTAPSPVAFDMPPEASEPTIKKKRKRTDARQLAALNRMYIRDAFPSAEERQQLAKELDMSARSVQNWFKNKRQASRQALPQPSSQPVHCNSHSPHNPLPPRNSHSPHNSLPPVTHFPPVIRPLPISTALAFFAFLAVLVAAFVVTHGPGRAA